MEKNETLKQMNYEKNLKQIHEANDICKAMGMNIRFEQCIIKQLAKDTSGRSNSINAQEYQFVEELQIRVQNFDKGGVTMMWNEEHFLENFDKMKEKYA